MVLSCWLGSNHDRLYTAFQVQKKSFEKSLLKWKGYYTCKWKVEYLKERYFLFCIIYLVYSAKADKELLKVFITFLFCLPYCLH